ncbi:MAG: HPF/RaiA family ribosome-associated protein [Ferruginibacter sp.]
MDIIIQSLGFTAGPTLEDFVREKLNTLKGDRIIRANVTLFKGPAGNPDSDYCEIRLEVPGNDHFVKKQTAWFETSVSECVEVLANIINNSKKQSINRQADKSAIQDALLQSEDDFDDNDVELEDVVR